MEQRSWKWTDAHFCSLPSQTSIYGCTKIQNNVNGTNKLLVASLVGRFFTIDYQRIFDKLTPSTKEVQFTYIPGESEIVSVDATNKCRHGNGLTIGITFWKLEDNESKQFLNTYHAAQSGEEFNLESVAQGCQSLQLDFMPFHLTHTELIVDGNTETVFLLSGSDSKVHLYREVSYQHSFKEDSEEYFPEFKDLPSVVLWLDIKYYSKNTRRLSVTGHQDGVLKVSIVDVQKCDVLQSFSVDFDNPITYVKAFSHFNKVPRPSFLPPDPDGDDESDDDDVLPEINILVLSALIPATVYRDILHNGLKEPTFLPDSNKFDAVLTGCIIDVDFDGENEILIGTYGQEVLAYKLTSSLVTKTSPVMMEPISSDQGSPAKPRHRSGENESSGIQYCDHQTTRRVKSQENLSASVSSDADYVPLSSSKDTVIVKTHLLGSVKSVTARDNSSRGTGCKLLWQRSFPCPVMGINHLDIMGDGMEDLVIITLKGLHILQPDLNEVSKVILERLNQLTHKTSKSKDINGVNLEIMEASNSPSENETDINGTPTQSSLETDLPETVMF